ncbi:hypothetical protein PIB30_066841 [Stylosanthes scabra]|uniref:F-box associated beta-propeller type 1 domain-containing protein n=1 Tax=Stylosanthes scabra TaxID=79078 RepID=A0ABU6RML8_9FABA|nr:hypothetical protein [Stylosanthes scabra]
MQQGGTINLFAEMVFKEVKQWTLKKPLNNAALGLKHFGDDFLWMIFVNAEPKLAAKCRCLSKKWCSLLTSHRFLREKYKAISRRNRDIIVGVGYPPSDLNATWFLRVDPRIGEQIHFRIPTVINVFGHYTLIGSDHGNLCIRVTESGLNSRILIWNPLTEDTAWVRDEAWRHRDLPMSVDGFGYLSDTTDYRIIHVWKASHTQRYMGWCVYKSKMKAWSKDMTFISEVEKLGPQSVVCNGIVFWIGWEGFDFSQPNCIVSFNFKQLEFCQEPIPPTVSAPHNSLAKINGGVAFMTYREIPFSCEVVVWDMYREDNDSLVWQRKFKVKDVPMPYTPSILLDGTIVSILECRVSSGAANNAEKMDLYIFKMVHKSSEMKLIYHNHWEEEVSVKSITLHSEGLYPVQYQTPSIA